MMVAGFDGSIGFVGLGGMGRGLVKNMLKHGLRVSVFDIDAAAVETAVAQGAEAAQSANDLAARSDVFGICVTTAEVVQQLALGSNGALAQMKPGSVFLDHTTTSPQHVEKSAASNASPASSIAEGPMTRTPMHADRASEHFLLGGETELLERLHRALKPYSRTPGDK
jgi:3-hydroxyisobutyrate dehydrogenase-like beta-hydroxyacid dehydrogenase